MDSINQSVDRALGAFLTAFSRRPRAAAPGLPDITATILGEFAVPKTSGMIGHSVF
jgi:hypothetical protein